MGATTVRSVVPAATHSLSLVEVAVQCNLIAAGAADWRVVGQMDNMILELPR